MARYTKRWCNKNKSQYIVMNNKKGTVLIYTLVLVFLSTIMATVIFNIAASLASNSDLQNISSRLSRWVLWKWDLAIKYTKTLNTNGSWFIDVTWCPSTVSMSGATLSNTSVSMTLSYADDSVFCSGNYTSWDVKLYFNPEFTELSYAEYDNDTVSLSSWVWSRSFFDSDNTNITFTPVTSDSIDDNFNSDDYMVTSTWSTLYPDWFLDDDADARKNIYGYVNSDAGYTNIFWNNLETSSYINNNPNNSGSLNLNIGTVSNAYMKLDVNSSFKLKIFEFDRLEYAETKVLVSSWSITSDEIPWGIGYIQNDAWALSLSPTKTGNEFEFDFVANDYSLFLLATSTWALLYNISAETNTGTWIYINPIDDSASDVIKVLANDMVIWWIGWFLTEQFEVIDFK